MRAFFKTWTLTYLNVRHWLISNHPHKGYKLVNPILYSTRNIFCNEHTKRRRRRNMVDPTIHNTTTYLEEIAKGNGKTEFEILILQGLELIHVGKGTLRCRLVVTERVTVNITRPSILFFLFFLCFWLREMILREKMEVGTPEWLRRWWTRSERQLCTLPAEDSISLLISTLRFIQRPRFTFAYPILIFLNVFVMKHENWKLLN